MSIFERLGRFLARRKMQELIADNQRLSFNWMSEQACKEAAEAKQKYAEERSMWYRSQLMTLRVSQAEQGRVGWEVMAYIPQEVADRLKVMSTQERVQFVRHVADVLVARAMSGLHHINSQGKVNALLFQPIDINSGKAPKAAEWCMALFDKGGQYKLSDKVPRLPSESERVKRLS